MPRVKPTESQISNRTVCGIIQKYQTISGKSDESLAKSVGVTVKTIQNWKNRNSDPITLEAARKLCRVLEIPNWEKVNMI